MAGKKKIIWAMDPFSKSSKRTRAAAETAKTMASALGAEIEPVYVLSPDGFNFTGDFSPGWIKEFKPIITVSARRVVQCQDWTIPIRSRNNLVRQVVC